MPAHSTNIFFARHDEHVQYPENFELFGALFIKIQKNCKFIEEFVEIKSSRKNT